MDNPQKLSRIKDLSEKSGIEMIVIDEAEKIAKTEATRLVRGLMLTTYIEDPIQSEIRQESPGRNTVELPGISFLVEQNGIKNLVERLNNKFAYRQHLAFISNDDT